MFNSMRDIDRMFGAMDLMRTRMDRIFNEFDRSWYYPPAVSMSSNSLNTRLVDKGGHFEVKADVPGMAKEDLYIRVQGNYLEISGSRSNSTPEGYKVHRQERAASRFSKSLTLPDEVDAAKVEATLTNGILSLVLPKTEAARPRQITIH